MAHTPHMQLTCAEHFDIAAVDILAIQDIPDALLDTLVEAVGSPAVEEASVDCRLATWQPTECCGRGSQQVRPLPFAASAPAWVLTHPHLYTTPCFVFSLKA